MIAKNKLGYVRLGGDIQVEGPDIIGRLARGEDVTIREGGIEFKLGVNDGPQDRLARFSPWVQAADAKASVTCAEIDAGAEDGWVEFEVKADDGRLGAMTLSLAQVHQLRKILDAFLVAVKSCQREAENQPTA